MTTHHDHDEMTRRLRELVDAREPDGTRTLRVVLERDPNLRIDLIQALMKVPIGPHLTDPEEPTHG